MSTIAYSPSVLKAWSKGSRSSARVVLPLVFDLLEPASVVDVGSSIGNWLSVCAELGVTDLMGVDGDYVERSALLIPAERFVAHDLVKRVHLERRFSLAMSLEVAEHLPEWRAEGFVEDLCRLAPAVLFSAAIPQQGGLEHSNEQWPSSWAEKFAVQGYVPIDCVRDEVWSDHRVAWWYAQNTILFVSDETATRRDLKGHRGFGRCPARVHPTLFHTYAAGRYQEARRQLLGRMPRLKRLARVISQR